MQSKSKYLKRKKMQDITIYTLDARDNFILEFTKEYFSLSDEIMHKEIVNSFIECLNILKEKKINYSDLKSALSPSIDKREIALVFDTSKIESSRYGLFIFDKIIELFDKKSKHSVLVGDFVGNTDMQNRLRQEFLAEIIPARKFEYKHSTQFYVVYINNLTDYMFIRFCNELKKFDPYVGYFDISNKSFIKDYLSTILVKLLIKSEKNIIQAHEDDRENSENINMSGYSFEKNGYKCKSLQSNYFDLFLSYKIERDVCEGFESDITLSLNAISSTVFDIKNFTIVIDEAKIQYLLKEHAGRIKKAGIINLTRDELENFIKQKIKNNYIYNLMYSKEHNTTKFNIIIEVKAEDTNEIVKLLVALKYIPNEKILKLITMY